MTHTAVDLRSNIDEVYDQSSANACFAHAVVNALDAMYDHAGQSKRFSRSHLWYWARFHFGFLGNNGAPFESMAYAVKNHGMLTADEAPWSQTAGFPLRGEMGYRLVQTDGRHPTLVDSIKHRLCLGIPLVWVMKVTPMFGAQAFYRDWKTSDPIPADTSQTMGEHVMCIVGYDDACQRFLVENSYGAVWGDGGFLGVPYTSMQTLTSRICHIDMAPINPQPIEGYTVPAYMTPMTSQAFVDRSATALKDHLMQAFGRGIPDMVAECKKWGVSDLHLETIFGWERGVVRNFKAENASLDWDGFVWDQL